MIRRGIARADRRLLDQNIVFTGDFLHLIEEGRSFDGALQSRLLLR